MPSPVPHPSSRVPYCAFRIPVGLVFVASAWLKAVDVHAFMVEIAYYRIVVAPGWVMAAAVGVIFAEAALGAVLLVGPSVGPGRRGLPEAVACGVLVGFTGLLFYGWRWLDLDSCGCFGSFVTLTPAVSIVKNLVLLTFSGVAWWGAVRRPRTPLQRGAGAWRWVAVVGTMFVCVAALGVGFARGRALMGPTLEYAAPFDAERPFARFRFEWAGRELDLGRGDRFVALLSVTCDDCHAAVALLNELPHQIPELPPPVALVLGTRDELETFRAETHPEFATILVPPLEFLRLTRDEPPRFHLTRDGRSLEHWAASPPDPAELLDAVMRHDIRSPVP